MRPARNRTAISARERTRKPRDEGIGGSRCSPHGFHRPDPGDRLMLDRTTMPEFKSPNWTDEQVELLRSERSNGVSFGQIAIEMNGAHSRNACIGKAKRLGIGGNVLRCRARSSEPRKPRASARRPIATRSAGVDPANSFVGEPVSRDLTLLELTSKTCRWPHGNGVPGDPYRFCGHDLNDGSPYCEFHWNLSLPIHHRKFKCTESNGDDNAPANQKELIA